MLWPLPSRKILGAKPTRIGLLEKLRLRRKLRPALQQLYTLKPRLTALVFLFCTFFLGIWGHLCLITSYKFIAFYFRFAFSLQLWQLFGKLFRTQFIHPMHLTHSSCISNTLFPATSDSVPRSGKLQHLGFIYETTSLLIFYILTIVTTWVRTLGLG